MMTIKDLAERWGVTIEQAKEVVISGRMPMIELRATAKNVRWATTRFDPDDVEAWEADRKRVRGGAKPDAPEPAVKPRGRRPDVPNHLGKW